MRITLGGGRSIQLSYWGIFALCTTGIFYSDYLWLSRKIVTFFAGNGIYCPIVFLKGAFEMLSLHVEPGDLDDMIFDEYDGGPSDR